MIFYSHLILIFQYCWCNENLDRCKYKQFDPRTPTQNLKWKSCPKSRNFEGSPTSKPVEESNWVGPSEPGCTRGDLRKRGSGVTPLASQRAGSQSDRETEREQQSRNKNALLGSSISLWFLWDSSSTSKATLSLLILIFLLFPFRFFLRKVKKNVFERERPSFLSFSIFLAFPPPWFSRETKRRVLL